jgi:hypothetical protein
MAQVGEAPEAGTPAAAPAAGSEAGADVTLDDMAAVMAESRAEEAAEGGGEPAPAELAPKDEEKPGEPSKDASITETTDSLRKGFVALARDRKKMQEREARAANAVKDAESFKVKAAQHDSLMQRIAKDPVGVLRELGGEDLINRALDGVIATEKSPAEREVEKLRNDIETARRQAEADKNQQLVVNWKRGIVSRVQAAADKYDLTVALGMEDAVVEAITQYHMKYNGAVLDTDVAAKSVEDMLAAGLAKSKKFASRGGVKAPATETPIRKTGATTLSGVASGDVPHVAGDYQGTDDERFEAVIKDMTASGQI